jgi:CRP-like cAMP-binding protein
VVRRLVGAFAAATVGEWVLGTTVAIHAYAVGGALLVGLVGFRFVPAAAAGLVTAQYADTHRRERVLTATALTRAAASALAAGSLALGLPFAIPLLLVWIDAMAGSAYRPAQAALLPTVVRTPSELTAATAACSNAKSSSQFLGALAGGLLVANEPVAIAVCVATALYLAAAGATAGIRTPGRPVVRGHSGVAGRIRRMLVGAGVLRGDREAKEIVAFAALRSLVRGLWISLGVVAALRLLGLGRAGFGILMAAAAAGALAGIPLSRVLLVGRRHLAPSLAIGLILCGAPIAAIGVVAAGVPAVALMVVWGVGMAISDAAGQALLNRVIPAVSIGSVTGFMESGKLLFEGSGSMIAPLLVVTLGIREALIGTGAVVVALVFAGIRSFAHIDGRAVGRVEVIELLAGVTSFPRLRVDSLEGLVAQLEPVTVPAGTEVVARGARDDSRWYLIEDGDLDVDVDGFLVNELGRGDAFGELALLRDTPRTATVRARTAARLLSLDRAAFQSAVIGPDVHLGGVIEVPAIRTDDHVVLLGRTMLLQGIGRGALEDLARGARSYEVAPEQPIVVEGERDDCYYLLLRGRAAVTVGGEPRRMLLPGDGFGEIAVLHGVPRSASVTAAEACLVLSVPGDALRAAARERGGLLGQLAEARRPAEPKVPGS